jgi:hypothetical protein
VELLLAAKVLIAALRRLLPEALDLVGDRFGIGCSLN